MEGFYTKGVPTALAMGHAGKDHYQQSTPMEVMLQWVSNLMGISITLTKTS
jgi:hypothetical protein